jgi:hypothetical protein
MSRGGNPSHYEAPGSSRCCFIGRRQPSLWAHEHFGSARQEAQIALVGFGLKVSAMRGQPRIGLVASLPTEGSRAPAKNAAETVMRCRQGRLNAVFCACG